MLESQRNPNLLKFKNGLTVSDVARPDETHDLNSFSMKYAAPVRKVTTFGRPFKEKRLNSDQAAAVILVCLDLLESDEYKLMEFFYPVMLCDLLIPSLKLVKADALAMEIQKVGEFVYNAPFEKIRTMKIAFSGDEVAAARGRLFGNSGERILPKLRIGIHNDLCAPLLKALEPRALKMKPTKALKADAFSLTVQATDKKESGSRVGAPFALLKTKSGRRSVRLHCCPPCSCTPRTCRRRLPSVSAACCFSSFCRRIRTIGLGTMKKEFRPSLD
jgi:hypothetical protein